MGDWTGTIPSWGVREISAADLQTMASALTALTSAWVSYTPTFTSSGTPPAIGNGTIAGRYLRVGHFIAANVSFTAGTTTTFGTGELRFGMPATNNSGFECFGSAILLDAGTTRYTASCLVGSATAYALVVATNTNFIQATVPFTWTTSDQVLLQVIYPAA